MARKRPQRSARRQTRMQLQQYVRITRRVADGARAMGEDELASELDRRVADAILDMPRQERVRALDREEAGEDTR